MKVDISDSPAEKILTSTKNILRKYLLIEPNPGGINLHNALFNANDYAFKILSWSAGLSILRTIQEKTHSTEAVIVYYIFGIMLEFYLMSIVMLLHPRSDIRSRIGRFLVYTVYFIALAFAQHILVNVFEEAIISVLAMK